VTATRRAAALTIFAVAAGLALPVLAASLVAVDDPDDTAGRLDVHEVRLSDLSGTPPSWTVITFNDWTTRQIWDQGYILLFLDTKYAPDPDYFVLLRADRDRLVGTLWRDRDAARDDKLFAVPARRVGSDGARVSVPLDRLSIGPKRTLYRWSVTTLFTGKRCRRTCIDNAPDATMIEEPLPTPSPTPTPTPS
jgi:hypothetical protein